MVDKFEYLSITNKAEFVKTFETMKTEAEHLSGSQNTEIESFVEVAVPKISRSLQKAMVHMNPQDLTSTYIGLSNSNLKERPKIANEFDDALYKISRQ